MRFLAYLPLLFLGLNALGQDSVNFQPPPPHPGDADCIYKKRFGDSLRMQLYPFSSATRVELVSFRCQYDVYPIRKDTILRDSLLEVKLLNRADLLRLTDLLYNYVSKGHVAEIGLCFYPRNAILFQDSTGKTFDYFLLCFHCHNFQTGSERMDHGFFCSQMYELLRKFFRQKGIRFGTDPKIEAYPGEQLEPPNIKMPPQH